MCIVLHSSYSSKDKEDVRKGDEDDGNGLQSSGEEDKEEYIPTGADDPFFVHSDEADERKREKDDSNRSRKKRNRKRREQNRRQETDDDSQERVNVNYLIRSQIIVYFFSCLVFVFLTEWE